MNHKRIGLLGGSFDPLHFGHLNMAIALSETHRLDSVLFCPAYTSPFKTENPPAVSAEHRLAMVSCGIRGVYRNNLKNREFDKEASQNSHLERATIVRAQGTSEEENFEKKPTPSKTDSSGCFGIKQFSTLDWEIAQNGPSYTIDTIKKLKDESAAELFLLLGEDQLFDLHRWKNVEELFTLCKPLTASRDSKIIPLHNLSHALQGLIAQGRTAIPMMDISSTAIRERLKQKRFCGHLVPALILDYIERHHLYI